MKISLLERGARWSVAPAAALFLVASAVAPMAAWAQSQYFPGSSFSGYAATSDDEAQAQKTAVEQYWTPERLLSAQPMDLHPVVSQSGLPIAPEVPQDHAPPSGGGGAPPSVTLPASESKVLIPPGMLAQAQAQAAESLDLESQPEATSSFGAYFTTSRVFPDATTTTYPTRTAGKLFFTEQGVGDFVCSASVLRPRIVVTAGHCVAHPSTTPSQRHFYTNWLFIPAYNNGAAPFGTWTPNGEWVTNTWYFSDGSVPNAQDVGMLIINDHRAVGAAAQKIGNVTGWLGWEINVLSNDNVTMLGYPCNLDSCLKMQETGAQAFESGGNNTTIYGSAMRGGASGGPWIQDYGVQPVGAPPVAFGGNILVGVTSYGPIATSPEYLGASDLDSRFQSLLTSACGAASSGNC
jgi:V8-like Glu-specific endopeptidase